MKWKDHLPQFVRRAPALSAVAIVAALALGGWALAEGDLPLLSSSSTTESGTVTSTTTAGAVTAAGDTGQNTDNVAAAVNTKDGKSVFALSLKITQTTADVVDPVNAAVAVASCEDCQTVAIALEAVLVAGPADVYEPTNLALAINSGCTRCQTLATAYQTVVQNDTRVRISGAGRREIADIRTDLLSLRNSGLDILTIQQLVDAAADRLVRVLDTEVFPIGRPPTAGSAAASTTTVPPSTTPSSTTTVAESTTTTTTSTTMQSTTTTAAP